MFRIISDGACDFSPEQVRERNIHIVPFYITFDGTTYLKEGIDISITDYFNKIQADKNLFPKTSQPNPQDYMDAMTPYLEAGEDVLIVTIASKLSGSYNSAIIAQNTLSEEFPERKIEVIDSTSVTAGQALLVNELITLRDSGASLTEAADKGRKIAKTLKIYFTLDTLEYLKRGGRVGPTTALVGGILGLKPILQVVDGEISQVDNVRGQKKVISLMVEGLVGALSGQADKVHLAVGHILRPEDVVDFRQQVESALDTTLALPEISVGVTIGAHAGPGALVVAYGARHTSI